MRILITGANGFLGKEFKKYFSKEHEVLAYGREELDVAEAEEVFNFFENNEVDVILHAAFVGGKRNNDDNFFQFCQNTQAFKNLMTFKENKHLLFCFGSGASYDRSITIRNVEEEWVNLSEPQDFYGKAKNMISRFIENHPYTNTYDFRLFGCFGKLEEPTRFIKNALSCVKKEIPIIVHKNKIMDFFYVKDLCKVIEYYMQNKSKQLPRSLNMCYEEKHSLLDIANMVKGEHPVNLINPGIEYYTGNGKRLAKLPVDLIGLENGIKEMKN
jgi:nucleoside-diphosphate-sugar epimerase